MHHSTGRSLREIILSYYLIFLAQIELIAFSLTISMGLGLLCGISGYIHPAVYVVAHEGHKERRKMMVIEARDLTKTYRRGSEEIYALKGVDLSVDTGEFVSIIGPSGSGKTALLNVLGCLDTPTRGSMKLSGVETHGLKERDLVKVRRDNIGFVFQQFFLMPTLTARENIELPLLFARMGVSRSRVDGVLEKVGLADRGDHLPGQMSGGEMQRVAIGRALINDPKIIMAR
jgi:putative ABC transport system ATP-binding protein